jgi:hypothetical protein
MGSYPAPSRPGAEWGRYDFVNSEHAFLVEAPFLRPQKTQVVLSQTFCYFSKKALVCRALLLSITSRRLTRRAASTLSFHSIAGFIWKRKSLSQFFAFSTKFVNTFIL